jgi:hypothetical protein
LKVSRLALRCALIAMMSVLVLCAGALFRARTFLVGDAEA